MVLNAVEWKRGVSAHRDQSQAALCDPDTQEIIIPEERASLVDGITATIKSVFPEKGTVFPP